MKKTLSILSTATVIGLSSVTAQAVVIDFTGGTATLADGTTVTTNNAALWTDQVRSYTENGMKIEFNGGYGTIGDYYSIGAGGFVGNDVIHAHWGGITSITFSKIDNSPFDLNYFDVTSNTTTGGGQATGQELSFITASNGHSMLLPSSDWGFAVDYFGQTGDGVARLWLDTNFDQISSFTVTSENAYCFGLDNFYIDEPAPPVPEPSTMLLLGGGIAALVLRQRRRKSE